MVEFRYALKDKIAFYWEYFISKAFCLWFEVKRPKLKMFIYEMIYSASKFISRSMLLPSPFKTDLVETRFGRFRIRPGTVDMSNVSTAFERRDMNFLLKLTGRLRDEGKNILFLDIGADLGTYSITLGNRFKDYKGLHIMAFEPAKSSYGLLRENIEMNGLAGKVEPLNFALWSEEAKELEFRFNPSAPGSSGLRFSDERGLYSPEKVFTRTLNSVLAEGIRDFDVVVFKIDVEGVEAEVLRGADKILNSDKQIYLLVEDFINPGIIDYLKGIRLRFITKLTPYNSWWEGQRPRGQ